MPTRITLREPPPEPPPDDGVLVLDDRRRARGRRTIDEFDVASDEEKGRLRRESRSPSPLRRTLGLIRGGDKGGGGGGGGGKEGEDGGVGGTDRGSARRRSRPFRGLFDQSYARDLAGSRRPTLKASPQQERRPTTVIRRSSELSRQRREHLSRTDISASPRLVGYMYMATAGVVCSVSAALFKRKLIPGIELYGRRRMEADGPWGRRYLVEASGSRWGSAPSMLLEETTAATAEFVVSRPYLADGSDGDAAEGLRLWDRLLQESSAANGTAENGTATNENATSTNNGTAVPSLSPGPTIAPSFGPTIRPSTSRSPTVSLSRSPSDTASQFPSIDPSAGPTDTPSTSPSVSAAPSARESDRPSVTSGPTATSPPSVGAVDFLLGNGTANVTLAPSTANGTASPSASSSSAPSASQSPTPDPSRPPTVSSAPTTSIAPTVNIRPPGGCIIGDCQSGPIPQGAVLEWKVWAAIIAPAALCVLAAAVVAVHFDKTLFPQTWKRIFRDGSHFERNFLVVLAFLWGFNLYACTSANSIGALQPNVFFSSWIGFLSVFLTYNVWRTGADKPSITAKIRGHPRLTTWNWLCMWGFSTVTTLAIVDVYLTGQIGGTYHGMKLSGLARRDWLIGLLVPGMTSVWCLLAPLTSHWTTRPGVPRWVRLSWRQVEGVCSLALVGIWSYALLEFTGVSSIVNGVNNVYLGVWGTFMCSIFTWGTWVRDNRDVIIVPGVVDMRSARRMAESRPVAGGTAPQSGTAARR